MAIDVQLEDENGTCIELLDEPVPQSLNLHNMPFYKKPELTLTQGIDPYGDTLFNRLQAERLLKEWALLTELVDKSEGAVMEDIGRLIIACRDGVHLYLRFIGD